MKTTPARLIAVLAVLVLAACPKDEAAKTGEQAAKPADMKAKPPTAESAGAPAGATSDPECIGDFATAGPAAKYEIGGRTFEQTGAKLQETSTDPDDQTVIGVLADIKEDTPENLKNILAILEFFKAEKAEAIIVNGDLGETEAQTTNVLQPIAAAGLPTFVIIGNREKKSDFNNAVKAIAEKSKNVFNLNFVRLVVLDDVAFVSLPGYFNKDYIHVESGCNYKPSDAEALPPIIKAAGDKTVVMVSHGPPKQDGPDALDRTLEQVNVGDPALARVLQETGVKFGVFSNIHEAGGRATDLAGSKLVGEGKMSAELYLNPGPTDAVRWQMNDRTESHGMAAVLTVKGKQAQFKIHRMAAPK